MGHLKALKNRQKSEALKNRLRPLGSFGGPWTGFYPESRGLGVAFSTKMSGRSWPGGL